MPLYEYECLACGARFEQIQKFSDPIVRKHAGCGGKVRKLLSAPAIQFKGTGWYITDYARAGKSDGDRNAASDGDKKGDKKQVKTAATSEAKSSTESKPASSEPSKTSTTDTSKK
jgi:putative FmdB family regulatory protein